MSKSDVLVLLCLCVATGCKSLNDAELRYADTTIGALAEVATQLGVRVVFASASEGDVARRMKVRLYGDVSIQDANQVRVIVMVCFWDVDVDDGRWVLSLAPRSGLALWVDSAGHPAVSAFAKVPGYTVVVRKLGAEDCDRIADCVESQGGKIVTVAGGCDCVTCAGDYIGIRAHDEEELEMYGAVIDSCLARPKL
jgi:hypothetical protein